MMTHQLVHSIVNQFIRLVEKLSHKYCFKFDACDFKYRTRQVRSARLIDIIYVTDDSSCCCDHEDDVVTHSVTIDYTAICFEHLMSKKWYLYLKKLAHQLLSDIVEYCDSFALPKRSTKKCRKQPEWCRFPTKNTTVIKAKCCEPPSKYQTKKVDIVVEKDCECIEKCKSETYTPKHKTIIKCEPFFENSDKCHDDEDKLGLGKDILVYNVVDA
ncbi:MAG: hypothetical protein QXW79_01535 [Thermoplasmata archaeon]